MKNYFYTKNQKINDRIQNIEELRKEILLLRISPRNEIKYRFEALQQRIYYHFLLRGTLIKYEHIFQLLSHPSPKTSNKTDTAILQYKSCIDYLYQSWLVNDDTVTRKTIKELYHLVYAEEIFLPPQETDRALQYFQVPSEHPLIQAALAHVIILDLISGKRHDWEFSQIVSLLFIYKYGYDIRGLILFEDYIFQNKDDYNYIVKQSIKQQNLTDFIDFFLTAIDSGLRRALESIKDPGKQVTSNSIYELNKRQKQILDLFNIPTARITNRDVQQAFNVSQITASRDLAKLTTLGLLFSAGKGRSVYYTKV